MSAYIRCIAGQYEGRRLRLRDGKALQLPVKSREDDAGVISIAARSGQWTLQNSSPVVSQVNGVDQVEATLQNGDHIRVGKMVFEVCLDDQPDDGEIEDIIVAEPTPSRGQTVVLRMRGDEAPAMAEAATGTAVAEPEAAAQHAANIRRNDRARRRISASRLTAIDSQPKKSSLFSRVQQVFRRGGGRKEDYARLVRDRDRLLNEVGRRALEQQGGIGLPEGFLRTVTSGSSVTIRQDDLATGDLEVFRRCRQRLAQIDAEVEAMRHELRLADEGVSDSEILELLSNPEAAAERAHQAMDGMGTERLEVDEAALDEPKTPDPDDSSVSGRRRRRRR